jgi:toxin ParE1/3/4
MRSVVWSADAGQDYLDILDYIAGDNPLAAQKVANAIEKAGNDLGRFATGRRGRVAGTYEKVVVSLPYIIVYALASLAGRETVVLLRVIHTARDWPVEGWPR